MYHNTQVIEIPHLSTFEAIAIMSCVSKCQLSLLLPGSMLQYYIVLSIALMTKYADATCGCVCMVCAPLPPPCPPPIICPPMTCPPPVPCPPPMPPICPPVDPCMVRTKNFLLEIYRFRFAISGRYGFKKKRSTCNENRSPLEDAKGEEKLYFLYFVTNVVLQL